MITQKENVIRAIAEAPSNAHVAVALDSNYMSIGSWLRTNERQVFDVCGVVQHNSQHYASFVPCTQFQALWCQSPITLTRRYWRRGTSPSTALMGYVCGVEVLA